MKKYIHKSSYFYGNKISEYGLKHGYIDYATLAKSFDTVLNNEIIPNTHSIGYWELVNGADYWYEDGNGNDIDIATYEELDADDQDNWYECTSEIYQYYIISEKGFGILSDRTNELVFYNEKLDMYVWGVTHFGTSWDYVLTDIKIELGE